MKVLVAYDSRDEHVAKSAKFVAELLRRGGGDIDLTDISQREIDILAPYDKVVVGAQLWLGKFTPSIRQYLLRNLHELLIKPTFIFVHAYVGDEAFQSQVAQELSLDILTHATTFNVGMDVDMEGINPIDKLRWNVTHQRVEKPFGEEYIQNLVKLILQK